MTAAELIKELLKVPPDTQIRVYADHGQHSMMASTAGMQYVTKEDFDKYGECDSSEPVQVFEIGAP